MNLQEIKEREAKATEGPWVDDTDDAGYLIVRPEIRGQYPEVICGLGDMEDTEYEDHCNASFIAHAREDVPALIAEIERLRKEIETEVNYRNMRIGDFEKEVEQLQAENKQLKIKIEDLHQALVVYRLDRQ